MLSYFCVNPKMLDVGCGTGTLAIQSARAGANVTGIDISEGMLHVARKSIDEFSLQNNVTLHQSGVVEIDALFESNHFDLITSISELVNHKQIILPLLCATGVERKSIKNHTGWHSEFGPVYSKYIPAFLKTKKLDYNNTTARFSLPFRIEMLLSMNFLLWFVIAVPLLLINSTILVAFSSIFWGSGFLLYIAYPLIPGNSGWFKSILVAIIISISIILYQIFNAQIIGLSRRVKKNYS